MLCHITGGAAGSVAKITGSVGATLAAISFDQDYKRVNKKKVNLRDQKCFYIKMLLSPYCFTKKNYFL